MALRISYFCFLFDAAFMLAHRIEVYWYICKTLVLESFLTQNVSHLKQKVDPVMFSLSLILYYSLNESG